MLLLNTLDRFLDGITMYRLILYQLLLYIGVAFVLSFFHGVSFNALSLIVSTLLLVGVCWVSNKIFSKVFDAPTNVESVYITALILDLILTPLRSMHDVPFFFWAALLSMASKYIFALGRKHVFNPVVIAVVLTSLVLGQSASWWVGNMWMMPFVFIGGLMMVRKLRRLDLVWSFGLTALVSMCAFTVFKNGDIFATLQQVFLHSSFFFFAFVMLTEPLTTPPTKQLQIIYGGLVGFLFIPQLHIGGFSTTPEIALLIGNIFSYIISPKQKLLLRLKEKIQVTANEADFIFNSDKKMSYLPGQYMEWTLPHAQSDSRGNRRYFTLASSPTEDTIRLGVKFYPDGSTYKKALSTLTDDTTIVAAQLSGDFTLSKNPKEKCVFIAGGIGITPFRSMIQYLVDTNEARLIILFYVNKTIDEIMYRDVFTTAQKKIGVKVVYTITDKQSVPKKWNGRVGRIDEAMIRAEVPDFLQRVFYLSGPHAMVVAYEETLLALGIKKHHIKKDFFPGFA